jgi:hypothetical protein
MLTNDSTRVEAHLQAISQAQETYGRLIERLSQLGVEMVDTPELVVGIPGSIVYLHRGQPTECYWWGYERIYTEQSLSYRDVMRRLASTVGHCKRGARCAIGPFGRELLRSWLLQGRPAWELMDFSEMEVEV